MRKTLITGNRKLIRKRFQRGRWRGSKKKKSTLTFCEEKSSKIIPCSLLFHSEKTLAEVGSDLSQRTVMPLPVNKTPCHWRDFWPIRPLLWL